MRKSTVPVKLSAALMREAKARAMRQLREAEPDILEETREVVPRDTGSLASTARLEWNAKGFIWRIGDLQGIAKFVDYHAVVDDRTRYVDGWVVPAIRFVLERRALLSKVRASLD